MNNAQCVIKRHAERNSPSKKVCKKHVIYSTSRRGSHLPTHYDPCASHGRYGVIHQGLRLVCTSRTSPSQDCWCTTATTLHHLHKASISNHSTAPAHDSKHTSNRLPPNHRVRMLQRRILRRALGTHGAGARDLALRAVHRVVGAEIVAAGARRGGRCHLWGFVSKMLVGGWVG